MKKVFVALCFALVFVSCENASMEKLVAEYNKMFVPSEDVLWTEENIAKGTLDVAEFEEKFNGKEFVVNKNTSLLIIGGPRDCTTYMWTFTGRAEPLPNQQILNLPIHSKKTNLITGEWDESGSLAVADYKLSLEVVLPDNTRKGPWTATVKVEE